MKKHKNIFSLVVLSFTMMLMLTSCQQGSSAITLPSRAVASAFLDKVQISADGQNYEVLPGFKKDTFEYNLSNVPTNVNFVYFKVMPESSDVFAVTLDDGSSSYGYYSPMKKDDEGSYSKRVMVLNSDKKITVKVTSADRRTNRSYVFNIKKGNGGGSQPQPVPETSNANLKSIAYKMIRAEEAGKTWVHVPSFYASVTSYAIEVENSWSTIAISSALEDETSVSKLEMSLGYGAFQAITNKSGFYTEQYNISVGLNTIRIRVTPKNGSAKVYTVNVTRARDNTPPTPEPSVQGQKAKYGILLYGCGGGNLDNALAMNLRDAAKAGSNANVKMAAQYKWSRAYQSNNDMNGTFRDVLEGNSWVNKQKLSNKLELYKSQTLTDFINWAAAEIPAEHYILIVWNHGDVWNPYDDSPTPQSVGRDDLEVMSMNPDFGIIKPQAAIYDDILGNKALSTASLAKGISDSKKPIKTVYFDVCLMLMMETLQEIRVNAPVVEYCMGAEHLTPGMGGNYKLLLNLLGKNDNVSFESKMKDYIIGTATAADWWNRVSTPHDLTMIRMHDFDAAVRALKDYVETFSNLDARMRGDLMSYAYSMRYQSLNDQSKTEKSTDLLHFLGLLSQKNRELEQRYNAFRNALRASYVENQRNRSCRLNETSVGVYMMRYFKGSQDSYVYKETKFDQAVRWSLMLENGF